MVTAVNSLEATVERIVAVAGPRLTVGLPLGLGKPNHLINALCARVVADPALSMTLYTALSLDVPQPKPGLESAFAGPFLARQFGTDYPVLDYVRQLKQGTLSARIQVHEFYFQSGAWMGCERAQRDYVSLNYTHVARELARLDVNVMLHLVARRGDRLSLSCNPDVTFDAIDALRAAGKPRPLMVCAVHPDLPFLGHDAEVGLDFFDLLIDAPAHKLFALPREPVIDIEHAIGLHASALVRDGGTLQIGIGALSDALVHALIQRHQSNADYRSALRAVRFADAPELVAECGGESPFERGLYGASEMVMDGFMHLRHAGILKRQVFDDLALQRLLNRGLIGTRNDPHSADAQTLERLIEANEVPTALDRPALDWLMRFGLLPEQTRIANGELHFADGARVGTDLLKAGNRHALSARICGRRLRGGRYLHGAFYLGTRLLYDWLRQLSLEDFEGLCMTRVSFINELYGGREALDIAQRFDPRFFNTCMMHTLSGAAVSDGLADGRVVSGVGGQYNFVAMAHAIPDGRSILMLRSVRETPAGASSNIVWNYGHITIPRHLRDIVITEYGSADLRGQSDQEVIKRLLAICDARFQPELMAQARAAGKLAGDFVAPEVWQRNSPQAVGAALHPFKLQGSYARYPFGSDFDAEELALLPALGRLKADTASTGGRIRALLAALLSAAPDAAQREKLRRVGLDIPADFRSRLLARMLARRF
ncbi:MAG: acetyl-CoA hydrolase/transferase C-terminal domain-containing protein [Pseudomonadota bacterium]|nr:acetyl-CoA hydrolase/transferase C-terminal domain-containing protein [Pseudomonadota bacterium]